MIYAVGMLLGFLYVAVALQEPVIAKAVLYLVAAYCILWVLCWLWCLMNAHPYDPAEKWEDHQ